MVLLANLVFNFHSGIYTTTTFTLVNIYLMENMKKPIEIPVSLFFAQYWSYFGQNVAPKTAPTLLFFWLISNGIYKGIQLILITCCNLTVLKKSW